jgi:hypothetical protein
VITPHTEFGDIQRTAQFMKNKKRYTVYLQPDRISVSNTFLRKVMVFQDYLVERGVDAKIVPQVHKMLGIK